MNAGTIIFAICVSALALAVADISYAAAGFQGVRAADDQGGRSVESERQRLGNERIRLEMERRAREEARQREEEERARLRAQQAALERQGPANPAADSEASAPLKPDMSKMLEQLRTLGELRDAGYVTDAEFQRIKQRILDDQT